MLLANKKLVKQQCAILKGMLNELGMKIKMLTEKLQNTENVEEINRSISRLEDELEIILQSEDFIEALDI